MKVHELITILQNYPMDLDVICPHESSYWGFDEEDGSYEFVTVKDGPVERVEDWTAYGGHRVVRISSPGEKPKLRVLVHGKIKGVNYDWLQTITKATGAELELVEHIHVPSEQTHDAVWFDECSSLPGALFGTPVEFSNTWRSNDKPHLKFIQKHPWKRRKKR